MTSTQFDPQGLQVNLIWNTNISFKLNFKWNLQNGGHLFKSQHINNIIHKPYRLISTQCFDIIVMISSHRIFTRCVPSDSNFLQVLFASLQWCSVEYVMPRSPKSTPPVTNDIVWNIGTNIVKWHNIEYSNAVTKLDHRPDINSTKIPNV